MHLTFTITLDDAHEFAGLPEHQRATIVRLLAALKNLHGCPAGVKAVAMDETAGALRMSFNALSRRYRDYVKTGDWRVLLDRRGLPNRQRNVLPPEFVAYWFQLCDQPYCPVTVAHRDLVRRWKAGEGIPGYSNAPVAAEGSDLPIGWTLRNLRRVFDMERTLRRHRLRARPVLRTHPIGQ